MFCFWKKKKNVQSDALVRSHPGTENHPSVGLKLPVKTNLGALRADTVSLLRSMEFSDNKEQRTAKPDKKPAGAAPPESQTQSAKRYNLETKSQELMSQLPEKIKSLLPDTDHYCLLKYYSGDTAFVEYAEKAGAVQEVFMRSYHPFISQFTTDMAHSADSLLQYIGYSPYKFQVYDSVLVVELIAGYWQASYEETPEYMTFNEWCQESQHDGAGHHSKRWVLCRAQSAETQFPLCQEKEGDARVVPPCRGYWLEGEHCFVVDPWNIPGVFEFYYRWEYSKSYNSASEISEIGDPHLNDEKWKSPLSLYMQKPRRE